MRLIRKNIVLLGFLSFFFYPTRAQIIQIGSGTNINSVSQSSPVNIYYRRTVSQIVYTKAELNAAGKSISDTIKEIGFFVFAKPIYDIPGYTIKIKHVNQTNVNTALGTTGWTTVKNSFTFSPKTGEWNMIKLDVPFLWNGTQNIGIEICWNQVQPNWNSSGQCYIFNSTNGYRYTWTDAAGSSCGSVPGTKVNYKPQIRFKFRDYTTWLGIVSTDWFNPLNWDAGVPTSEFEARIPALTPFEPIINNAGAECLNLTILLGGSFTINNGFNLSIYGNLKNYGTLNANSSSFTIKGKVPSVLELNGTQQFYDLIIENPQGVSLNTGQIFIRNTLQLMAGKFNTGNACTILSDSANTARITEIKNACKYVLTMNDSWGDGWNGGYITLFINGINKGKYFAKSSQTVDTLYIPDGDAFSIKYTSGSYENENSYSIKDPSNNIIFTQNAPPQTGNVFSSLSNCSFSNPLIGNITMQRYIAAGQTNWRFLTVSTQGATINDWKDDFIMSGFPGSHFPNWPSPGNPWSSIHYYNESIGGNNNNGFQKPSNITNSINQGQGLWVWCGDTITGTQPFTIDVTGNVTAGVVNLPVSFTNTGWPDDDGWNMLGNPYPCTIDWDDADWIKTNIDNAIYIWNPNLQQYSSYVAGVGTNGGGNLIASGQAFWVKANATLPQLISNEKIKVNQDVSFIKQSAPSGLLKLAVNHLNKKDETIIAFNNMATSAYDTEYDAYKLSSVEWWVPYIASVNNNIDLSINSFDSFQTDVHIPIKVIVHQSASAYIKVEGIQSISNLHCIYLEDLITGIQYDLKLNDSVPCFLYDTTQLARFILHIGATPSVSFLHPSCYGFNDGAIVIKGQGNGPWDIMWQDTSLNILKNSIGVLDFDTIQNIPAGSYIVTLTNNGFCGNYFDTIQLIEPDPVVALFSLQEDTVYLSNGANVFFSNNSINANNYFWDFGDGNTFIGSLPSHSYAAQGTYNVVLVADNNYMCKDTFEKFIYVLDYPLVMNESINLKEDFVYFNGESLVLKLQKIKSKEVFITISNILGQVIFNNWFSVKDGILNESIYLGTIQESVFLLSTYEENGVTNSFKVPVFR